jgi:hypothetical protein
MRGLWLAAAAILLFSGQARAQATKASASDGYASFALIIGVNRSIDRDAPLLRYADDDAARYLDLFRTLGARSYVLSRLDDNTRRLHPQLAAEAQAPRLREYRQAIATLAADVEQAHKRGVKTILYFVYAGHGNVKQGSGYITLEDARLHAADLESEMLAKIHPDQEHLIVDACYSYFLAVGRGPGGARREARGFSQLGGLLARPTTGLLFSTSSAKESHEWAGFQAGIFSHEIRSGLYGAADADGDGRVSYREIAAFVERANASIDNERFRPEVFVRPPLNTDVLVDLTPKLGTRLDFKNVPGEHQLLEDERGVRYADIHNADGSRAYLLRPWTSGKLYLRRTRDEREVVVPLAPSVVSVSTLASQDSRIASRGAANDAFEALFALPFDERAVRAFRFPRPPELPLVDDRRGSPRASTYVGYGLLGVGAAAAGVGVYGLLHAQALKDGLAADAPQASAAETAARIRTANLTAGVGFAAAGATGVAGLVLLLWPESPVKLQVDPQTGQAMAGYRGAF